MFANRRTRALAEHVHHLTVHDTSAPVEAPVRCFTGFTMWENHVSV